MIASAEKSFPAAVPDRECEIALQVLDAVGTPRGIGLQNQTGIGGRARIESALFLKLGFEFFAAIEARVGRDPQLPLETLPVAVR